MVFHNVSVHVVDDQERRVPVGIRGDLSSAQQPKGGEMNQPIRDDDLVRMRPMGGRTLAGAQADTTSKPLTTAQFRVAELVAQGMTNPEIATTLGLSRYTVESHLAASYRRIGIRSRVDLAILFSRDADRWRPRSAG